MTGQLQGNDIAKPLQSELHELIINSYPFGIMFLTVFWMTGQFCYI